MSPLEYRGVLYSVAELSKMTGLSRTTIDSRLHRGWPVDRIVETPAKITHRSTPHRETTNQSYDPEYKAALCICKMISADPEGHNFRRIASGKYAFDGDILGWRISYDHERTAHLTAFYRKQGIMSGLKRSFHCKETIKE